MFRRIAAALAAFALLLVLAVPVYGRRLGRHRGRCPDRRTARRAAVESASS